MDHSLAFFLSFAAPEWRWIWLAAVAFLAGLLNAVAGGGSFLLFPALMGVGQLLPIQANATNTVALWPGQLTSIAAYRQDLAKNKRLALPMSIAAAIGGTAGALVLLITPPKLFLHMVPWLLLVAASIFAVSGPVARRLEARRQSRAATGKASKRSNMAVYLGTAVVCFYIGYFGAGAGFLIITLLSLLGFADLHEINALKVLTTTLANGVAFVIFAVSGLVVWQYCLLAMVSCAVGGYSSARLAHRVPQPVLRGTVIVIGFSMAAWFFIH